LSVRPQSSRYLIGDVSGRQYAGRAHFDDIVQRSWGAGCPSDCRIEIGHVDDTDATQTLSESAAQGPI
jgi:hypothetical protein